MHFVLSYDIHADQSSTKILEDEILKSLNEFSWVKPLSNLYMVYINSEFEWSNINERLTKLASINPGLLFFLMSPIMIGGNYNGWLNEDTWKEINLRSN